MVLTGLIQKVLGILNGILGHFVSGTPSTFSVGSDFEWVMIGTGQQTLSAKGNYLTGAIADITAWGAILVDWIVQVLAGYPLNITG